MKKLNAIMAVFLCLNIVPAHADTPKVMAIIDTGVDISHPAIKSNIIYEVCVSYNNSCPNKQNFMEGSGSATITPTMYANDAWSHGTKVASAATQTDPNIKIIEIRCASLVAPSGYIGCNYIMLANALNWVTSNKDKYNIGIVVSPLSKALQLGGKTVVSCDTIQPYVDPINQAIKAGIAVAFPTGNDYNYVNVANPACLPGVLAISAIDDKGRLALYANYSSRVDFASPGNLSVAVPGGSYKNDTGTSLSVATFGASWLKILNAKNLSYTAEYNLIKQTGTPYTNIMVKQNVLAINIAKALQ